jgi:OmpA-OmpF porin, OOP family
VRLLRKLRWGFPLAALALLAVLAAAAMVVHMRTGGRPFGSADRQVRAPDAPPQIIPAPLPGEVPRPAQERFTFEVGRDGDRLVMSGSVPDEEARRALLEEAKQAVPNSTVTEELKSAGNAPPGLEKAAAFALRQLARLPSGSVIVGEGTIAISGQSPDAETYNAIAAALRIPPEGFRGDMAGLIPPVVRPYTWTATSGEGSIALSGHVPSQAAREAVGAAARDAFPDKQLVERLQPAGGLPQNLDFDATVRFALAQLAQLRTGAVELVDARLNLRGDVTDRETLAGVRGALQTGLPPGLEAGSVAITLSKPSPYTFRARRDAGTLTLTGYYPDAATRTAIQQLVRERFLTEQVADRLRAAEGAPPNYLAGVSFGLEHLSRLASGEVTVSGTSLRLSGEALYPQTAEQTTRTVSAMSVRGWSGRAEVTLRPAEKADAALRSPQP